MATHEGESMNHPFSLSRQQYTYNQPIGNTVVGNLRWWSQPDNFGGSLALGSLDAPDYLDGGASQKFEYDGYEFPSRVLVRRNDGR